MTTSKDIFIDRDGVINKDPGGWTEHNYVTCWRDFHFLPRAKEAIRRLTDKEYNIIIISNQAGVGKGIYSASKLKEINAKMLREIEKDGGRIKKVYYCVHRDEDACDCRKPKIGLFRQAQHDLGVKELRGAYFIGDGRTDVEAAKAAHFKSILVLCGKTNIDEVGSWTAKPDFIFSDLYESVNFILKGDKS